MVQSKASTVAEYLEELPEDRRKAIEAVRKVILKNLPKGCEECMDYGVICYAIPLAKYPNTYNGHPLGVVALASQKNYMAVYVPVYMDPKDDKWFTDAYKKTGKKLDMGKCCVRFKKLDDLALDLIGEAIAKMPVERLIQIYEKSRSK